MKASIEWLGVFILVAILAFPASAAIFAQGEDWVAYMSVTTNPDVGSVPGVGSHFGFGARDGASDGYNSGEGDEIAPMDPIAGINAYFYYPSNPQFQRNLIMSVSGPAASITWPLVVKMKGETGDADMTISWPDISGVPAKYVVLELQDTGGTTLADMRSVDHYTFYASQETTYSFQIKAEAEEIPEYDLTISSTVGGNVTTPGEGTFTYDTGTVVDLVADADEGYRFVEWTGDVGTVANVEAASTTITMNGDYSITANFIAQYDLTIDSTAGGEVTTPGEGTFTYDVGTVVDLVAEADECYEFVSWTGDVNTIADINAASTNITMNDDYNITANFILLSHNLTVNSTAGGNVTAPGEGTFTYDCGNVVDLVATPDAGNHFDEWTGDVDTIADVKAAATTIAMNGDYSITAEFVKQYDVTINSTDGGSVIIPGQGTFTYDEGTVVDIVAQAEEGHRFDEWTGDVGTVADVNAASTNITMHGSYNITANFVAQYDLTIDSTAGGEVTTPGEGTYTYDAGTVVDLVATPHAGYCFVEWTGDVDTIADADAAATSITMDGNYTISASFTAGRVHNVDLNEWYLTIQDAVDAAESGNTIEVEAGEYDAFEVIEKTDISIISTEGATVTTALELEVGYWVMALVQDSVDITIDGIHFDGSAVSEDTVAGIICGNSSGTVTNLTVSGVVGNVTGWGIVIRNATIEMIGSTIADNNIGILIHEEGNLTANFNNVVGNDLFGVLGEVAVNATRNWWGNASGPSGNVTDPVTTRIADGSGDAVSENVRFDPWLRAAVVTAKTETVSNDTVDAKDEADTEVLVSGNATVTVALYEDNPGGSASTGFSALGKYIDVYVPDTDQVTEIEIRSYYTDAEVDEADIEEESLRLFSWNGTAWVQCSDSGVNTANSNGYSGYMWATIGTNTTPNLEQLAGTPFGGYGTAPSGPKPPGPTPPAIPQVKYDLMIDSTAGGSVTKPGEGEFTYNKGTVVNLVAKSDEGYRFVNWTGDVGTIADVNGATTTITMNGDYEITANFIRLYELTISSAAGGSVTTPGEGTLTYDKGTVVNLVAVADEGYQFVNWTGDVDTIANINAATTTVTVNGDYSITANFAVAYDLTISSTAGGSVTTPGTGTSTYDDGTMVNLVAQADEGYRFVNWTGDVDTVADVNAATTTITMNGDYSIGANFEEAPTPVNWPLIIGIIAAVVVVGLVIFFFLRRRKRAV